MQQAAITRFRNAKMIQGKRFVLDWSRLFDRLCHAREAPSKLSLPLWSPAIWVGDCRREGAEPIEVCAIVLDLDHGATLSGGLGAVDSGPMACLHTSWQHQRLVERKSKQPDGSVKVEMVREDRFRLVFPLSTVVAAGRYPAVWRAAERWMREEHGLVIDGQVKNAGRSWFVPAHAPGAPFCAYRHEGPLLDPWDLVSRWPTMQAAPPVRSTRAPMPRDVGREHEARLKRARAYISRMPESIAGQNGHAALWDATLKLVKGFELEPADALEILLHDFNPRCSPPWSEREITHKVRSAQRADAPHGFVPDRGRVAK